MLPLQRVVQRCWIRLPIASVEIVIYAIRCRGDLKRGILTS